MSALGRKRTLALALVGQGNATLDFTYQWTHGLGHLGHWKELISPRAQGPALHSPFGCSGTFTAQSESTESPGAHLTRQAPKGNGRLSAGARWKQALRRTRQSLMARVRFLWSALFLSASFIRSRSAWVIEGSGFRSSVAQERQAIDRAATMTERITLLAIAQAAPFIAWLSLSADYSARYQTDAGINATNGGQCPLSTQSGHSDQMRNRVWA